MHFDYIHVNPVKHGLVKRPFDWQWSTFRRYVKEGLYDEHWCEEVKFANEGEMEAFDFGG